MWSRSFVNRTAQWPEAQCEDHGLTMAPPLAQRLHGTWDTLAMSRGMSKAGVISAPSLPEGEAPVAVWFLGAPVEGNAPVAPRFAQELGVPVRRERLSFQFDAVVMDDAILRREHPGYKDAVLYGLKQGCVWRNLESMVSESFEQAKDSLLHEAVTRRQHIVMTNSSCSPEESLERLRTLREAGYQNHVVMMEKPAVDENQEQDKDLRVFAQLAKEANGKVMRFLTDQGKDAHMVLAQGSGDHAPAGHRRVGHGHSSEIFLGLGNSAFKAVDQIRSRVMRWGPVVFGDLAQMAGGLSATNE